MTSVLDTLSAEQRSLIESMIEEKANEKFNKMKEDYIKETQTPAKAGGKATGLTNKKPAEQNGTKPTTA